MPAVADEAFEPIEGVPDDGLDGGPRFVAQHKVERVNLLFARVDQSHEAFDSDVVLLRGGKAVGVPIVLSRNAKAAIDANDIAEANTNSYHVNITFVAPGMNTEFVMDVMRGAPCSNTPSGPGTGITSYDWCVNGTDGISDGASMLQYTGHGNFNVWSDDAFFAILSY
jgi:hypothetical protein